MSQPSISASATLQQIMLSDVSPRRLQRHLEALIANPASPQRLEANNFLAVQQWHNNDLAQAVETFRKTIQMEPHGMEAIWAMRMLSLLYQRLGLKAERCSIDLQRLNTLRRLLHFSDQDEQLQFAYDELKREYDDRDLEVDLPSPFPKYRTG